MPLGWFLDQLCLIYVSVPIRRRESLQVNLLEYTVIQRIVGYAARDEFRCIHLILFLSLGFVRITSMGSKLHHVATHFTSQPMR